MKKIIAPPRAILQGIFGESAKSIARDCGFVQRVRQFDPALFAQLMCLSLVGSATVSLVKLGIDLGISSSALCQRFSRAVTVTFFWKLLRHVLVELDRAANLPRLDIPIFSHFNGVYLVDATSLQLPECLGKRFPGCGGGAGEHDTRARAGVKILLRYRLDCRGDVTVRLRGSSTPDQKMLASMPRLKRGSLLIADMGFFDGDRFERSTRAGCFWLTRLPAQLSLQVDGGRWEQLVDVLDGLKSRGIERYEAEATISRKSPFRGRVLFERCPPAIAAERRRKLLLGCKGKAPGRRKLTMCDWWAMSTNAPAEKLDAKRASDLYRSRWQIELVFKRWKSLGRLRIDPKHSENRAACELYARLIGVLVVDWLATSRGGSLSGRSVWLAWDLVRGLMPIVLRALRGEMSWEFVLAELDRVLNARPKQARRKKKPSTRQILYT